MTAPHQVHYDAAITVSRDIQPEAPIGIAELAGGEYVTMMTKARTRAPGVVFSEITRGMAAYKRARASRYARFRPVSQLAA